MTRRLVLVASLCAVAVPAYALDPDRETSQYVITRWGGGALPSHTIHALVQTRDHRLWLGTAAGLASFDGDEFTVFTSANTPSFEDGGVSRLAAGADGSIYVGTTAGTILGYSAGTFRAIDTARAGNAYVSSLLAAQDGSLWVGVPGHDTVRIDKGARFSFPTMRGMQAPLAMVEAPAGVVWIGTRRHGLIRYEGGEVTHHDVTRDQIQALCLDRSGALWIGTPHGLLQVRDGRVTRRLTTTDGLTHPNVSSLLEDRDGNLWVGTARGLNRLSSRDREGRWSRLTTLEGLSDDDVRCLLEDHEGNLWVGTADGLTSLSDGRFVTYGRFEGLPEPAVASVTRAAGGGVWLGLESGRVVLLRDGGVREFRLPSGVGPEAVRALHETRDGSLWIAQDNGRLFRLKDGVASEQTPVGVPADFKVRSIGEDEQGPVFFVAALGPARIRERHFIPLLTDTPRRAYLRYPHAAVQAPDGTLWISDLYGLVRLRHGESKVFGVHEGLPHNRVRWASLDEDGGVWAATAGGLAYVKDDTVCAATTRHGLPEKYLRLVLDDGLGFLWLASMGRIFRLEKRELHDLFAGRVARVTPVVFDGTDGLRTTEGLLGSSPGFRAEDGRLWFATAKGVSVIDPVLLSRPDPAPPVVVEELTVDGHARPTGDAEPFEPGRGETRIRYAALSYRAPGKIRFRHRLEGFDRDWIDGGTARRASYSTLPAGRYRFRVTASNRDGTWNGETAQIAFAIRPPLHQTWPFYTACLALVSGLFAAAHRLRVNQMRSRFAAVVHERTRIARELHDTLAQGLAGVKLHADTALSAMTEKPDVARRSIQCARSIAVSSLSEVRRSIWVLRAQAAKGEDGLGSSFSNSLRQLTADTDLQPSIHVEGHPRGVPVEVERNLLRIAHEAVTNAVRHSGARTLTVDLRFETDSVRLRVCDDGRGFDPEAYLHGPRGEHFGLLGMRERVSSVSGELEVRSRPEEGTEVLCRLPYAGPADPLAGESSTLSEGAS